MRVCVFIKVKYNVNFEIPARFSHYLEEKKKGME